MTQKPNRASKVEEETELAASLVSTLPTASFMVGDQLMTSTQFETLLDSHISLMSEITNDRAALHAKIIQGDAMRASIELGIESLKALVTSTYGANSTQAITLKFAAAKRKKPTAATRAAAVEKDLATRVARDTKGKDQKEEVHGAVTATPPAAPPTEPAAPSPAATPQAPQSSGLPGRGK
jgi:hypothetical protein